jgi:hypothetical protein
MFPATVDEQAWLIILIIYSSCFVIGVVFSADYNRTLLKYQHESHDGCLSNQMALNFASKSFHSHRFGNGYL